MHTLGLLAIGQSPRQDYAKVIQSIVGPSVRIVEKGTLDGLGPEDFPALAPAENEHPVISQLADGRTIMLSKPGIVGLINRKLETFAAEAVDLTIIMCTSEFSGIKSPLGLTVLEGQNVIDFATRAFLPPSSRLGVIVPLASQEQKTREKFERQGFTVLTANANPYGPSENMARAATSLCACDAVVLHCMGYGSDHRKAVRAVCGLPVLQANALIGYAAASLLG